MCLFSGWAHTSKDAISEYTVLAGVHNHNALLEIVDCTDHCAEDNKKDAQYIADTMKPHIIKIDPSKQRVDFVIFVSYGA